MLLIELNCQNAPLRRVHTWDVWHTQHVQHAQTNVINAMANTSHLTQCCQQAAANRSSMHHTSTCVWWHNSQCYEITRRADDRKRGNHQMSATATLIYAFTRLQPTTATVCSSLLIQTATPTRASPQLHLLLQPLLLLRLGIPYR
jgi:hypothetical protein